MRLAFVALALSLSLHAAVTKVQATSCNDNGNATSSLNCTITASSSGNILLVCGLWTPATGTHTYSGATDNGSGGSNTYTLNTASKGTLAATHYANVNAQCAYSVTTHGGVTTVTPTWGDAFIGKQALIYELTAGQFDKATSGTGSTDTPSAGALTPSANGAFAVALTVMDNGFGFGSGWFTANSPFTLGNQAGAGNESAADEFDAQTSAASLTGQFNPVFAGDTGPWAASMIIFVPAGGGGATPAGSKAKKLQKLDMAIVN